MTPQEAKEILAIYRFNLIQSISNQLEGDIEALDMAIKSLESQKTAHFIGFDNPNHSPFDDSPEVLLKCSECGNAVLSMYNYCPMCGRKFKEGEE